jgi:hypothetical protein
MLSAMIHFLKGKQMQIQGHSNTFTTPSNSKDDYASVTYSTINPNEAPVLIWIGVVKLRQAFHFNEPAKNNQWRHYVTPMSNIMVTINATGDRRECQHETNKLINSLKPICNVHGHNYSKRILCSNGQMYKTQSEASADLGINQSAISAALSGRLNSVRGYSFSYTAE